MNRQQIREIPTSVWLSLATVVLQLIIGVVACVWVVGEISGTTKTLSSEIRGLSVSVEKLNNNMDTMQAVQWQHAAQLENVQRELRVLSNDK